MSNTEKKFDTIEDILNIIKTPLLPTHALVIDITRCINPDNIRYQYKVFDVKIIDNPNSKLTENVLLDKLNELDNKSEQNPKQLIRLTIINDENGLVLNNVELIDQPADSSENIDCNGGMLIYEKQTAIDISQEIKEFEVPTKPIKELDYEQLINILSTTFNVKGKQSVRLAEAAKKAAEDARIAAEVKAAEEARIAAEAKADDEARIAAEVKAAEDARIAAEVKAAEDARIAAEAKAAEEVNPLEAIMNNKNLDKEDKMFAVSLHLFDEILKNAENTDDLKEEIYTNLFEIFNDYFNPEFNKIPNNLKNIFECIITNWSDSKKDQIKRIEEERDCVIIIQTMKKLTKINAAESLNNPLVAQIVDELGEIKSIEETTYQNIVSSNANISTIMDILQKHLNKINNCLGDIEQIENDDAADADANTADDENTDINDQFGLEESDDEDEDIDFTYAKPDYINTIINNLDALIESLNKISNILDKSPSLNRYNNQIQHILKESEPIARDLMHTFKTNLVDIKKWRDDINSKSNIDDIFKVLNKIFNRLFASRLKDATTRLSETNFDEKINDGLISLIQLKLYFSSEKDDPLIDVINGIAYSQYHKNKQIYSYFTDEPVGKSNWSGGKLTRKRRKTRSPNKRQTKRVLRKIRNVSRNKRQNFRRNQTKRTYRKMSTK